VKLNHNRAGSGTPLVLIHGIGHRWQAWRPVLPLLQAHHEVIAIDLPGFGASPVPEDGVLTNIRVIVERLADALTQMQVDRPHVAGYSLGGAISLEMASAGLCESATAFSPAGFYSDAERKHALRLLNRLRATTFAPAPLIRATMASPRLRNQAYRTLVAHPERIDSQVAYEDALAMRRGRGFRVVAGASLGYKFEGPLAAATTIAWSEQDRIFPVAQAEVARTRLPEARHVVLRDCGHVPMSDNPALIAETILATTGAVAHTSA
jgi:pimeloyl-ACP methyl ester carboxylesterase